MKTTLKKILALGLMLPALFLTACGKDGGNSSTTTTTATYYWGTNGACYQTGTTNVVSSSLCSASTGYQLVNNLCYQTSTGQVVNQSLCYNGNTGATGAQCIGLYRWNGYTVQCNGADCRGYTLINATTGVSQYCQ
jgi:hypothetical protein